VAWHKQSREDIEGRGIGLALTKDCLDRCKGKFEIIRLEVFSVNRVAKKLYKNLGLKTYGVLPRAVKRSGEYYDEELMYLNFDQFYSSAQPQIRELNPKENKVMAAKWK
jgi:RimJ/RimL family protein N-acetyltransferase